MKIFKWFDQYVVWKWQDWRKVWKSSSGRLCLQNGKRVSCDEEVCEGGKRNMIGHYGYRCLGNHYRCAKCGQLLTIGEYYHGECVDERSRDNKDTNSNNHGIGQCGYIRGRVNRHPSVDKT